MTSRVRLSITLPAMEVMLTQHFSSALCEDWSDTGFSAVLKHFSHSLFTFRDDRVRQSFLPAPSALLGASCCSPWICVCQIYFDDLWTDTPWQKSSLPFPRLSYPHGLGAILTVKVEAKVAFQSSAFSMPSFSCSSTFSIVFLLLLIHLKQPFLSLTVVTRFNSQCALAFLVAPLHVCTYIPPKWPDPFCTFHLSFSMSSLFIHMGLWPPFLDFLLIGMYWSWAWRQCCLNVN